MGYKATNRVDWADWTSFIVSSDLTLPLIVLNSTCLDLSMGISKILAE